MMNFWQVCTCPYINKKMAKESHTLYYCDYDEMGFDSMLAHCKYCEIYEQMISDGMKVLKDAETSQN